MINFKDIDFSHHLAKIMRYLIIFLIFIFPQAVVYATEFEEAAISQNQPAVIVLQLTQDEEKWLAEHKSIRIAYDGSLPPYSFVNDQGKIDGIAVEIMAILSQRLGINFTVYPNFDWTSIYRAAAKREVDFVATMVNRSDRATWFSFTKPYLTKSLVIVTKQGNTSINNRNDLADKKIAVVKGYQYGEQVANQFPSTNRMQVSSMLDSLKAVDNGQVDAAIIFVGTANYLQAKYHLNNLKIAAFFDRNSADESIAVRKDWPILLSILQKGLDSLTEKEIQKIFAKWIVQAGETPSTEQPAQKIQLPTHPVAKPVVGNAQQPDIPIPQKKAVETTPELEHFSWLITVLLIIAALFLLFPSLFRKLKKRIQKTKHAMLSAFWKLLSIDSKNTHCENDPSTKAPPQQPETTSKSRSEIPVEPNNIEIISLAHEAQAEFPPEKPIHYQRDSAGHFSYISPSIINLLGYTDADFMVNYRNYLTDSPINNRLDDYIEACTQGQPSQPFKIEVYDVDQSIHWLELRDSAVYDGQGHCIGVDGVMHEIPVQKYFGGYSETEVIKAYTPQSLLKYLEQPIYNADKDNKPFALIFLSLSKLRFLDGSPINFSNNKIHIEANKRLNSTLRDTDTVVHLDADKFALVLPETNAQAVNLIIEKIRKILHIPYLDDVHSIVLDTHIGVAVYPDDGRDPEALINKAQMLLSFAQPDTSHIKLLVNNESETEDCFQLQQDLFIALDECKVLLRESNTNNINALHRHGQFSVYYQSKHNLENYSIVGFEALIRWHHPQAGLLLPKDFVPQVNELGLLDIMTYWVIQHVSFQAMVWEKQGLRPGPITINLGDLAIKQAIDAHKIIALMGETGAKPEWLVFSIPENVVAENPDLIMPIIKQLVTAGLVVAIDNFGSAPDLLSLLKTMPAQFIEIDPIFIRNAPHNSNDAKNIADIISALHDLGKTVIAKEVESEQQLELLAKSKCDIVQGHLLSRPLPPKEAKKLMESLPEFAWFFQQT